MKTTRIALGSLFAAALLSGCQHLPRSMGGQGSDFWANHRLGPTTPCHGASCQVPVSVDGNCDITAGHVDVRGNKSEMVNIVWHLTGGEFAPPAIFIKSGPPGHFGSGHGSGRVFTHQFRNSPKGLQWDYSVTVKVGTKTCTFDPYVMN